jgi:YesN/AraC family two-component response regulator
MRYFVSSNNQPLIYESSGALLEARNFIHQRRTLDTFVIIFCVKGTLHISQDERHYSLKENDYIILFAGHEHYGFKNSKSEVTYYWCHFSIKRKDYRILEKTEIDLFLNKHGYKKAQYENNYILPETGELLGTTTRAFQLFRQLLDISRNNPYSSMFSNYSLSLLAMEISHEFVQKEIIAAKNKKLNPRMENIIEWVRINYSRKISLSQMAKIFKYNPDYLSTSFRKYTGIPLMKYIIMIRIEAAKKKLINTDDSIKEIVFTTGFEDEKNFYKRFKQLEQTSPGRYRNTFSKTKLVMGNTRKTPRNP